ncbi:MAG TPA: DUF116 domain-containing protein [Methanocorpusculum sp.]|nr:DUF116 domain-containing protein [Methanocorpusculum sp.]
MLLLVLILWFVFIIAVGILVVISIKKQRMYLPKILSSVITLMEGVIRIICQIFGIESHQLMKFLICIYNEMNISNFSKIPVEKRVIFLPHCLRSSDCPARLTSDGIKCLKCRKCQIGKVIPILEEAGYATFIIPGSSFIKRMVKKYKPEGMIGVGCIIEVKEGLELGRKISITTMGIVNTTDGCLETTMNTETLLETASLGLDEPLKLTEK